MQEESEDRQEDYLGDVSEADDGSEFEREEHRRAGRHKGARLLTAIQVIGSAVVLAAALALRFSGSGVYAAVRNWYAAAVHDSLMTDEQSGEVRHTVVGLWDRVAGTESSPSSQGSSQSQGQEVSGGSVPDTASRTVSGKTAL